MRSTIICRRTSCADWGFDGFVTDDLGAVGLLTSGHERKAEPGHHISEDPVEATALAIKSGDDSDDTEFQTNIPLAVQQGLLVEADVDGALRRVMRVGFRLGVFDPPESNHYSNIGGDALRSPEHLALTLKNGRGVDHDSQQWTRVPAAEREAIHSVALIGPAGDQDHEPGNYYDTPARKVGPLAGLRELLGTGAQVSYEQGAFHRVGRSGSHRACGRTGATIGRCSANKLRVEAEGGTGGI